ncbi:MAG: alpha-N-arabinofuranosidase [Blautia sp.]|nr:alpha-N-arabinofuranosidase [Blautia sp.]
MEAKLKIAEEFAFAAVDSRLYGSFVEHLGRIIYGGIYDPESPDSDEKGFRKDVIQAVKGLNTPIIRYPGGNYVSNYRWEDSVGPVEKRPKKIDLSWKSIEPNIVGLAEFEAWAKKVDSSINMAVNLGTRGIEDARNLIEYCNFDGDSYYANLRRKHGHPEPYKFKTWCLGNEMDGSWQVGHKDAVEYGKLANEVAKAMKTVDDSIELVVCGSSGLEMDTFGDWELKVLEECYENVDFLSLHQYYGNEEDDLENYLAKSEGMDRFISGVTAICDAVKAKKKTDKTINLSFDEWNIWYHFKGEEEANKNWSVAPHLLEEIYNFEDALVIGCLLITLLKHADRVKIACLAQLVNVLAPIMTEENGEMWRQTTYFPFAQVSNYGKGKVLTPYVAVDTYDCKEWKNVKKVETIAVLNEESKELVVFAVNRSREMCRFSVDSLDIPLDFVVQFSEMEGFDIKQTNSVQNEMVIPKDSENIVIEDNSISAVLQPLSWNMIRIKIQESFF